MSKPCLMYFYTFAALILIRSISCADILCDKFPFPALCNLIIVPHFESSESQIKVSMTQARAIEHFLSTARSTFDARAMVAWMDCLELYKDAIQHLNRSTPHMKPTTDVEKWLNTSLLNHQACQTSSKDSNLSLHLKNLLIVLQNYLKTQVGLLAKNKPSASKLSMKSDHGLIQLANRGVAVQADLVVAKDGSGDFQTVTEAINASEERRYGTNRFVIYIKSGVYVENVIIKSSMTNLKLIGDGIDATIITGKKNKADGYVTNDTATFQIWGSDFVAVGITFENTAGPEKEQAVALLSASDHSAFYKCSFKGYQDTLCLHQHHQFFRECDIYGTIDFMWGDATVVLQNCNIYVRKPIRGQENTITAQGRTDPSSETGFVVHNSFVIPTDELKLVYGSVRTFLGRPWRDYSRVVFLKTDLDSLIDPQGWMPFRGSNAFDKLYYAEYMNSGNSANTTGRVKWLGYHVLTTSEEVEPFSVGRFLAGDSWIPQTGVPFYSGI